MQNSNQVTELRLSEDRTTGSVVDVITDDAFQTPSTAIRFDGHLAVVNAKFDTGFPPTADQYEVVIVDAYDGLTGTHSPAASGRTSVRR